MLTFIKTVAIPATLAEWHDDLGFQAVLHKLMEGRMAHLYEEGLLKMYTKKDIRKKAMLLLRSYLEGTAVVLLLERRFGNVFKEDAFQKCFEAIGDTDLGRCAAAIWEKAKSCNDRTEKLYKCRMFPTRTDSVAEINKGYSLYCTGSKA